jgi:hypothetical protein
MIDWGDGSTANVTEGFANLTHVYQTEGSFTISAKATDDDGQWQANPLGVTVTQQTHNLTPAIDFEAADLTQSAGWYYFTVTFNYPDVSIVPDVTHVLVTGPNDFSAIAELETLVGEDADTTFVATYRIAPADGHWDNADNGTYSVSLTAGGITSPAAGALGTFQSAVPIPDTIAPTVVGFAKSITTAIGAIYKFTIHYTDDSGLFLGDFDNGDLVVTGPDSYSAQAKFLSVDQNNNVTYSIVAPGGLWNSTDNGTYNITLADNAVHDAAGNALAGGIVGNISVNIGDIAGNTMQLAKNLKLTRTSKITLTNFVGSSDKDDYFKVIFTAPVNLSLALGSSGSFARLRVISKTGKTLKNLNSGAMSLNLNAGTYFIRLYSVNTTNTVYKTKLVTKATFSTTSIAA